MDSYLSAERDTGASARQSSYLCVLTRTRGTKCVETVGETSRKNNNTNVSSCLNVYAVQIFPPTRNDESADELLEARRA